MESEWEHQLGEEHVLRNQLKRLQDDLRRVNRHLEGEQKEKDNLKEKIGELEDIQTLGQLVIRRR